MKEKNFKSLSICKHSHYVQSRIKNPERIKSPNLPNKANLASIYDFIYSLLNNVGVQISWPYCVSSLFVCHYKHKHSLIVRPPKYTRY